MLGNYGIAPQAPDPRKVAREEVLRVLRENELVNKQKTVGLTKMEKMELAGIKIYNAYNLMQDTFCTPIH